MISVSTRVKTNKDAAEAVGAGVDDLLMDVATVGANTALEHTPSGGSNTLRASWFEPQRQADGSLIWGYRASYARFVEEGTAPHWIPVAAVRDSLMTWARRVLGDEDAAWAVRQKIAEEGTEGQHFVRKGVDAMRARLSMERFDAHVRRHL